MYVVILLPVASSGFENCADRFQNGDPDGIIKICYYIAMHSTFLRFLLLGLLCLCSCKENKEAGQDIVHKYTNALAEETSPYLLQHAHNPVDWRPWSEQALEDAERQNKLVLVSIGYSSCHWCHVMEEETFEDEEVARMMNENFVNIKVDREERPDIDQIYMTALQLISGNGGWPLNVITLPNGKPLYGGTYHTKDQWTQVLNKINTLYRNDPGKAAEYSDMLTAGIAEANLVQVTDDKGQLTQETLKTIVNNWKPHWDIESGGDKGQQKFMIPINLEFLLDYAALTEDETAREHVRNSLDQMALGGIYDHLGGGFYRYSTDADWKIPHFEKMLYDNAQVLSLYSKAYKIFKDPKYKDVVFETIAFLDREMKNPAGGYYAALNADSEGEEGKFYVWKEEVLKTHLGSDFDRFASYYSISPESVWEEEKYVLHREVDDKAFIEQHNLKPDELTALKKTWRKKLMAARDERVRPTTDDKIITSWNALLITGFVDVFQTFGQPEHFEKAESILQFLRANSYRNGRVVHTYKLGSRQENGFIEDYAFLADAALALYGASLQEPYLKFAQQLTRSAHEKFSDDASGMYRYTDNDDLIAKIFKTDDGVLPSPNAVMAHNLFRLGHIEYDREHTEQAKRMLATMVPFMTESAPSYSKWNALLLKTAFPFYEIAVVGKNAKSLIAELGSHHLPNALVVGSLEESNLPLFEDRYFDDGTFIYVCRDATCKLPVDTVEKALKQLENF